MSSRTTVFGLILVLTAGCAQEPRSPQPEASAPVKGKALTLEATGSLAKGSITADPNPVQVCDGSGRGTTALSWTSTGARDLQVHVGSANGPLFSASGPSSGPAKTGKWVVNGSTFYLQNTTDGLPLTSANTLSTVTMKVTDKGCP
jgi:hypothetical protein